MNDTPQPDPLPQPNPLPEPSFPEPPTHPEPARSRPMAVSHWARRLLACNPFYLLSAALLLYGCYRISIETGVTQRNSFHLFFNFSSLQFYEALIVATAIFLAGRRIWYDSTLLVGLENMLLFVPFILISHGALIGQGSVEKSLMWELCVVTAVLAAVRLATLRRFFRELNFPSRGFTIAMAFLVINIALPVVYRGMQETKFGVKLESGTAYWTNEWAWLLVLPAAALLGLLVPVRQARAESWPQRHWLPSGMFALWLTGTAVHLYSLDYIYDYDLRGELLAPLLVVLAWLLQWRAPELFAAMRPGWRLALLVAPFLASFIGAFPVPNKVFLCLALLNASLYSILAVRERDNRLAFNLLLLSLAAVIGGFPADWGARILPAFSRPECLVGAGAALVLFQGVRSRNPIAGLFGGIAAGLAVCFGFGSHPGSAHWGIQAGVVFVLLHSIRWDDDAYLPASWLRVMIATAWVTHSVVWVHMNGEFWMTLTTATPVMITGLVARRLRGDWPGLTLPISAALVLIARPAHGGAEKLQTLSPGFLIVIASFVLLAIGTVAALWRHRFSGNSSNSSASLTSERLRD